MRDINLPLCSYVILPRELCPAEIPMKKGQGPIGASPLEIHKVDQWAGAPFLQRQIERVRVVQSEKEKTPENLRAHSSTWRGLQEICTGTF